MLADWFHDGSISEMGNRQQEFSRQTQELAWLRQGKLCASCGTPIHALGVSGQSQHRFGETVQAHHIRHAKRGGTNHIDNCVVLCQSCHYSVHEGGNYRFGWVEGTPDDFPHYQGSGSVS